MSSKDSSPSDISSEERTEQLVQKIKTLCLQPRSKANSPTRSTELPPSPSGSGRTRNNNFKANDSRPEMNVPKRSPKGQRRRSSPSRGPASDTRRPKGNGVLYIPPPFNKRSSRTRPPTSPTSPVSQPSEPKPSALDEILETVTTSATSATVDETEEDYSLLLSRLMGEARAKYDPASLSQSSDSYTPPFDMDQTDDYMVVPSTSEIKSDTIDTDFLPSWLKEWVSGDDNIWGGQFFYSSVQTGQSLNILRPYQDMKEGSNEEPPYAVPAARALSPAEWEELQMLFAEVDPE